LFICEVKDFFDKKWLFVGNATKGLFNFVLKTTLKVSYFELFFDVFVLFVCFVDKIKQTA
jgi:hypothetical protein